MLIHVLPTLIMIVVVAIFLFLICETTISFIFYLTGFLLILTLVNLWYMAAARSLNKRGNYGMDEKFNYGETLVTKKERIDMLDM